MSVPKKPTPSPEVPDFANTQQAFAHLSTGELKKALWLFRGVGNVRLVRLGKGLMALALALRIPVGWAIRPTVYSYFCGGESIDESESVVTKLFESHVRTILDYSSEGQETEEGLDRTRNEILAAIRATRRDERHAFGVFKVSGVAPTELLEAVSNGGTLTDSERTSWGRVEARIQALCSAAAEAETPLLIDAEESWIQPAIDRLAEQQMKRHNGKYALIFQTIQLYRHDRLAYLRQLATTAEHQGYRLGVKLVRGAYMEKERLRASEKGYPSPIQKNKHSTDRDYNAALRFCLDHLGCISLCAGSHNAESAQLLCKWMDEAGIAHNDSRIWFAQLLGMSDTISFNLSASGYNVAKYVPYGPIRDTIPYLIRRAEENTSVAGQTSRELELLQLELSRRRHS